MDSASTVTVVFPAMLCAVCDAPSQLTFSASSVRTALAEIEKRRPEVYRGICDETGAVRRHLNLFVNTTHVRERRGLDTALSPGDVLTIMAAVSGG